MLFSFLCSLSLAAQAAPAAAPPTNEVRVAVETSQGRFVLALDAGRAPVTTSNFLKYVEGKKLDGILFYRTVKVAPNFGFVQFGVQNDPKRVLQPIKHEPTTQTGLRHLNGTISMARNAPGTATGDFTISVGDQPSLDADPSKPGDNQGYAAFGHVVEGMDVIGRILDAPTDPTRGPFKGEMIAVPVKVLNARRLP